MVMSSSSVKLERFLECLLVSASGLSPLETGRGADFKMGALVVFPLGTGRGADCEMGASLTVLAFFEVTDIDLLPPVSSWSTVFRLIPCF